MGTSSRAPIERIGPARLVYSCAYGDLYNDAVAGPDGQVGTYLRWSWNGAGVIVVPTDGHRLYLWPMYRYPIGAQSLEFPRGAAEKGESEQDAAARELAEETGFTAITTQALGRTHADTGLIASSSTIVLARIDAARPGQARPEATEAITGPSAALTVAEMSDAVRTGRVRCALTIAAFIQAALHLGESPLGDLT
jgi:ADP-ribose pyrophosphatase